jgi:hypothetical protein
VAYRIVIGRTTHDLVPTGDVLHPPEYSLIQQKSPIFFAIRKGSIVVMPT